MAIKAIFDSGDNLVATGRDAGEGETARDVTLAQVDPGARPGNGFWDSTTNRIKAGTKPPEGIPAAARLALDAFTGWARQLEQVGRAQPDAQRAKVHDYLYRGLEGLYLTLTDKSATAYNEAGKIKYAEEWGSGAADVTDARTFYAKAKILTAPTGPFSWVSNPTAPTDTPQRLNLANGVTVSGTEPDDVDLIGGDWIAGLT